MEFKFIVAFIWFFSNGCLNYPHLNSQNRIGNNKTVLRKNPNCKCGVTNDALESRIVGGVEITPHKYPWLAQIYKDGKFHCGGSLISDYYVMSAGHCVMTEHQKQISKQKIIILLGVNNIANTNEQIRQVFKVKEIKMPKAYYSDYLHDVHDIVLFKLNKKVAFDKFVSPACLPRNNKFTYTGRKGIIAGWGTTTYQGSASQLPLEATAIIIPDDSCKNVSVLGQHFAENPLAMFCAYNEGNDACQGDSGGPMFIEEDNEMTIIGIISWGIRCAESGVPGVYTRVSYYLEWVQKQTYDSEFCS